MSCCCYSISLHLFDTIYHDISLRRLKVSFGISGIVNNWFSSYLLVRLQSVHCNSSASSSCTVLCRVPQRSVSPWADSVSSLHCGPDTTDQATWFYSTRLRIRHSAEAAQLSERTLVCTNEDRIKPVATHRLQDRNHFKPTQTPDPADTSACRSRIRHHTNPLASFTILTAMRRWRSPA